MRAYLPPVSSLYVWNLVFRLQSVFGSIWEWILTIRYQQEKHFYGILRSWTMHWTCTDNLIIVSKLYVSNNVIITSFIRWQQVFSWWRYQMETFSAFLPLQRPETQSFDVFFDLRLNKWLRKQSRRRWLQTPSCSLWRHCYVMVSTVTMRLHLRTRRFRCPDFLVAVPGWGQVIGIDILY